MKNAKDPSNKWKLLEFERLTLDEWEKNFHEKGSRQLGELTAFQVWLRSVDAGTCVAESIRKEEYMKAIKWLGDAFGLLCYFVKKIRETRKVLPLSKIAWNKYPGMCYACADKVPENEATGKEYVSCICLGMQGRPDNKQKSEKRLRLAREKKRKPETLDEWSNMIKSIYKGAHSVLPISAICLHFIEEIGEVTRELYEYDTLKKRDAPKPELEEKIKKLEEEIADTFSWIFGLINKIDQLFEKARDYYEIHVVLPPLKSSEIARDALIAFPKKHE